MQDPTESLKKADEPSCWVLYSAFFHCFFVVAVDRGRDDIVYFTAKLSTCIYKLPKWKAQTACKECVEERYQLFVT